MIGCRVNVCEVGRCRYASSNKSASEIKVEVSYLDSRIDTILTLRLRSLDYHLHIGISGAVSGAEKVGRTIAIKFPIIEECRASVFFDHVVSGSMDNTRQSRKHGNGKKVEKHLTEFYRRKKGNGRKGVHAVVRI